MQTKSIVMIAVVATTLLAACGSKTDATEKNFAVAISKHLEGNGQLCLGPVGWPVDLEQFQLENKSPNSDARKLAALEAAGLVKSEDIKLTRKRIINGAPYTVNVKRYELTEAAKPFSLEKEVRVFGAQDKETHIDLCWGRIAVDEIVKWEGPKVMGDYQEAAVYYRYKIDGLADWASRPDIQAAYLSVKRAIEGAGKNEPRVILKLTNLGWEVK